MSVLWLLRISRKLAALFVFLCAVYFVREVIHEAFDPKRQMPEQAGSLTNVVLSGSTNGFPGGIGEPIANR